MRNTGLWMGALMAASLLPTIASAQEGMPDTRKMTCPAIQALMAKQGAVVLATSNTTYDRYVIDVAYCYRPDVVKPMWVPSQNGACYVGGICWDPANDSSKN